MDELVHRPANGMYLRHGQIHEVFKCAVDAEPDVTSVYYISMHRIY